MPKATLVNEFGNKVVVESGSPQAQQYFANGFKLDTGNATPVVTPAVQPITTQPPATSQPKVTEQPAATVPTVPPTEKPTEQPTAAPAIAPDAAALESVFKRYGLTPPDTSKSPITQALGDYQEVYKQLGLPTVKEQLDKLASDYGQQQQELAGKIADINENPWITEGLRQAKVSDLQKRYELKNAALVKQMDLYRNIFESGRQEAQFVATQAGRLQERQDTERQKLFAEAVKSLSPASQPESVKEFLFAKQQGFKGDFLDFQQQKKGEGARTAAVQEYEYYKSQEESAGRSPLTFDEYQARDANRKQRMSGIDPGTQDLVNAVLANPEIYGQLSAKDKAAISGTLNNMGFTAFGKPLSDTAIKEITQTETAIEQLNELKTKILANLEFIGPLRGLQALNPYSEGRKVQADINLVKQMVGKALEGGVLRKEDEEKYKKILATVTDEPTTALYKINNLIKTLESDVSRYKKNQELSGRNVPGGTTSGVRGIVQGFDISSYATDPMHEEKVANIVNSVGQFRTLGDVESHIRKVAPKSPITAEMISATSQKYGVPWEVLVAIMQQDSSLGTAGLGAKTMNPGNVGNNDAGQIVRFPSWQAGVDAVGSWLSRHRKEQPQGGAEVDLSDQDFKL